MIDYIISYDISALAMMLMFSAYYFTRKRFNSRQNLLFKFMVILVSLSILSDILSVVSIRNIDYFGVPLGYIITQFYFLVTGSMAICFCMYTLRENGSINLKNGSKFKKIIFFVPFFTMILIVLTTPITKLVFYFDEEGNYLQGPFMFILLIVVVLYLACALFLISFYHAERITLKKRFPYYLFIAFMFGSIVIQWYYSKYLLYGFAEAIGIVILYLSNHNPGDMIDNRTGMFNRRALFVRLSDLSKDPQPFCLTGIVLKDLMISYENSNVLNGDYILFQVGEYLQNNFTSLNTYYIDNYSFAIMTEELDQKDQVIKQLRERFADKWEIKDGKVLLDIRIAQVVFPDDDNVPNHLVDNIELGLSIENDSDDIIYGYELKNERDRIIGELKANQRKLEERYIQTENEKKEALKSDRYKTLFLTQMSHEIRTPMTAILGMTELVLRESNQTVVKEHASAIANSGKILLSIINDILDFSKIEAGKMEIHCDTYQIAETVFDSIKNIIQRILDKDLNFQIYYSPDIPRMLSGDEIRIKQILLNILTNACKYTPSGTIKLMVDFVYKDDDGLLTFSVEDTGIGIAKENIDKLFIGFERFDSQKNKYIEGTGLGLPICKRLIDAMGGTMDVESIYGKGSKFKVTIPQKVIDNTPYIRIDNPKDYKILFVNSSEKSVAYRKDISESIGVESECVYDIDEINNLDKYTHIFIDYDLFEKYRNANNNIVIRKNVYCLLNINQSFDFTGSSNIMVTPISSISLSGTLTGKLSRKDTSTEHIIPSYEAENVNLLIIDDNMVNLKITSGLLECHKMSIDLADSGEKGIEKTMEKKYDLIFLDHMMPGKDGIETLHDIRAMKDNPNLTTPVIAFTANAVTGMKEMFLNEGFSNFLSKPIDIAKLEQIIADFIPREKIKLISGNNSVLKEEADKDEKRDVQINIAGVDMDKALFYAGGSYDVLISILDIFAKDGNMKSDLQTKYIKEKDYNNYRIEIHAVKSLCKGIGAEELSEKARLLEEACKEGNFEYVEENYLQTYNEYKELITNVERALSEVKSSENSLETDIVSEDIISLDEREMLVAIHALVKDFESDLATKLIEQLSKREMSAELRDSLNTIREKMQMFDYDGVAELIDKLL